MLQLTNLSTHPSDQAMFDDDTKKAAAYIERLGQDGLEVSQGNQKTLSWLLKGVWWA